MLYVNSQHCSLGLIMLNMCNFLLYLVPQIYYRDICDIQVSKSIGIDNNIEIGITVYCWYC